MLLKQILMWCHHWLNLADRFMFINVWLTGQQTTPTRQMGSAPGRCGVNHCGVTESKLVSRKLIFVLVLTTPERRVYTIDLVMDSAFTFKTSWMNFYIEIGLAVCEYLEEETNIRSRVSNMHTHTHTLALHEKFLVSDQAQALWRSCQWAVLLWPSSVEIIPWDKNRQYQLWCVFYCILYPIVISFLSRVY